jgi:hypothetical protein
MIGPDQCGLTVTLSPLLGGNYVLVNTLSDDTMGYQPAPDLAFTIAVGETRSITIVNPLAA